MVSQAWSNLSDRILLNNYRSDDIYKIVVDTSTVPTSSNAVLFRIAPIIGKEKYEISLGQKNLTYI